MNQFDIACQALFAGRINVPRAAAMCSTTTEDMKKAFRDYVLERAKVDWELDITPCWPYA